MMHEIIDNALNGIDPAYISQAIGNSPDKLIMESMVNPSTSVTSDSNEVFKMKPAKHQGIRRIASVAVAACLILALGTMAFATNFFGLRSISTESKDGATVIVDAGTEMDAATEWANWLENHADTNIVMPDSQADIYFYYGAHTQEARDALNSIAARFHLSLFTDRSQCDSVEQLYALLHTDAFLPNGSGIGAGDVFDMKSVYSFMTDAVLENGKTIKYDLYLKENGYLMRPASMLTDTVTYEENTYTVSSTEITLALGEDRSYILAATDTYSLAIYIRAGSANNNETLSSFNADTVTMDDLKEFAESINFNEIASIYFN